jgi:Mrp family chromosome partitioning ATPase
LNLTGLPVMSAIDQAFIRAYEIDEQMAPVPGGRDAVEALPVLAPSPQPRTRWEGPAKAPTTPEPHFRIFHEPTPPPPERSTTASERRPLSTFAPPHVVEARFRPSLEVDAFRWPAVCDDLVANHKARWTTAIETFIAADDAGRSLIGVASVTPGAGATTVVACLARLLVDAGKTVAVVDGNFSNAYLAAALGLGVETGWEDVLAGRAPLAEAVIQSIGDRVAVLPLVAGGAPAAAQLDAIHASVTAGVLRYHYDMVLFDLGALSHEFQGGVARRIVGQCRLDGVALVAAADDGEVDPRRVMQTAPELAAVCLGVIHNEAVTAKSLSENRRGLAQFAESSE